MKSVLCIVVLLLLSIPAVAGERLSAVDETVAASAPVEFPSIAVDQTRSTRVGTHEAQDPTYYDPDAVASGIDPCKDGVKHPDKRCLKDNNVYYCTSQNAVGRKCGMYLEGTSSQICKTCV